MLALLLIGLTSLFDFSGSSSGQSLPPEGRPSLSLALDTDRTVGAVALSGDGSRCVCSTGGGAIQVFDTRTGRKVFQSADQDAPVTTLAANHDGTLVASAHARNVPLIVERIHVNSPGKAKRSTSLGSGHRTEANIREILFGGKGLPFTVRRGDEMTRMVSRLSVWDVGGGIRSPSSVDHTAPIVSAAFAKDHDKLTIFDGCYSANGLIIKKTNSNTQIEWDGPGGGEGRTLFVREDRFPSPSTSFDLDGSRIATLVVAGGDQRMVLGLSTAPSDHVRIVVPPAEASAPWAIAASPDGRHFVTAGPSNEIVVWDFDTGVIERRLKPGQHNAAPIKYLKYLGPNDTVLSCDGAGVLRISSINTGRGLFACAGPAGPVRAASFHDNVLTVAHGAFDSTRSGSSFLGVNRYRIPLHVMRP